MSKQLVAVLVLLIIGVAAGVILLVTVTNRPTHDGGGGIDSRSVSRLGKRIDSLESSLSRLDRRMKGVENELSGMRGFSSDRTREPAAINAGDDPNADGGAVEGNDNAGELARGPGGRGGPGGPGGAMEFNEERVAQKANKEATKLSKRLSLDEGQAAEIERLYMDEEQRKFDLKQQERDGILAKEDMREMEKALKEETQAAIEALLSSEQLEQFQKKGGPGGRGGEGPGGKGDPPDGGNPEDGNQ